jgi:hypothetical protein
VQAAYLGFSDDHAGPAETTMELPPVGAGT